MEGYVPQAGALAVKARLLITRLRDLDTERSVPVGGVKVVAIGLDLEIQKRQQIFPENEGPTRRMRG